MTHSPLDSELRTLDRGEGALAFSLQGEGPLVVTSPGMGELRQTYRFLSPAVAAAGYQVADADLRGHGDSDATFARYGDEETGRDLIALIEELGAPAVLVGNSMSAAAAVWAAAERPELVSGLVLVGPFVRNPGASAFLKATMRVLMARPWAAAVWKMYLPNLYAGRKPDDMAEYRAQVAAALKRPGRSAAFSRTTRVDHAVAEVRLPAVSVPTLVVMGEQDPDFPDPKAEADWVAEQLGGEVLMVPDAGHYPHAQRPDVVIPAVLSFLARATADA